MGIFAVFGNPIKQSQSSYVHALFAAETGIKHHYTQILSPLEDFEQMLWHFFDSGGLGANITLPFKERAFSLCDQITKRGFLAKAVNTIKRQPDGSLLGDNTDGVGLISDLRRLNLIHKNSRILLVGAGGAARGVIHLLLDYGCEVVLTNRTFFRAQELFKSHRLTGKVSLLPLEWLCKPDYDLIINATPTSLLGNIPPLPRSLITSSVCCYDMCYQSGNTSFITWCYQHGALHCADGLGMLVNQAAASFLLWHGILPSVIPVLKKLRAKQTS